MSVCGAGWDCDEIGAVRSTAPEVEGGNAVEDWRVLEIDDVIVFFALLVELSIEFQKFLDSLIQVALE